MKRGVPLKAIVCAGGLANFLILHCPLSAQGQATPLPDGNAMRTPAKAEAQEETEYAPASEARPGPRAAAAQGAASEVRPSPKSGASPSAQPGGGYEEGAKGGDELSEATGPDSESKFDDQDTRTGRILALLDCYNLALAQMETIGIEAQRIKEAEAHFLQAMGILMPEVSFVSSDVYSHTSRGSSDADVPGNHTYERAFVFQQTLFSGFRDFALMSASNYEKKQRRYEKERAEQLLFGDVSDSFYLFLQKQEDIEALKSILQALSGRVQELNRRIELGRSRKSEVAMVRVQIFSIRADIETARGQRDLARELLEFYVGGPVGRVVEPDNILTSVKPVNHYLVLARKRSDVLAAENAVNAANSNVLAARSGYLPTVNVQGAGFTARDTFPQSPKWEGGIAVNVPLFTGTQVYGNVKQAKAIENENKLQLQLTGRQGQTDVLEAYTVLQYALSRRALLIKALDAAGENYSLQRKDYERNQVNNLDVLTAIQSLLDQKRNLIQASSVAKQAYWRLCVAAGQTVKDERK